MSILAHVGDIGWSDCFWSDDNLSSKKIYPNFQFPSKSKHWLPRVRTSSESMALMVKRAHTVQEKLPNFMRKKADPASVEALAERAAVVLHFVKEVLTSCPQLSEAELTKSFIDEWTDGNDQIDFEIQGALLERSDNFVASQHIPSLRKLVDSHMFLLPVGPSAAAAEALEVDAFELVMRQLDFDVKAHAVWLKKCENIHMAKGHAQREWALRRDLECKTAARSFVDKVMKLLTWDGGKVETVIGDIMTFRRHSILQRMSLQEVPALAFLNWTTPCAVTGNMQDMQTGVLTWLLHDNMQSCAVVLAPVFTYTKGRMHLEESKMMQQLIKGNHNVDHFFNVLFKDKCDLRDERPMSYPGRLVFAPPWAMSHETSSSPASSANAVGLLRSSRSHRST